MKKSLPLGEFLAIVEERGTLAIIALFSGFFLVAVTVHNAAIILYDLLPFILNAAGCPATLAAAEAALFPYYDFFGRYRSIAVNLPLLFLYMYAVKALYARFWRIASDRDS